MLISIAKVEALYERHSTCGTWPGALIEVLQYEVKSCQKIFIIIDALDECTDRESRQKLSSRDMRFVVTCGLLLLISLFYLVGC